MKRTHRSGCSGCIYGWDNYILTKLRMLAAPVAVLHRISQFLYLKKSNSSHKYIELRELRELRDMRDSGIHLIQGMETWYRDTETTKDTKTKKIK